MGGEGDSNHLVSGGDLEGDSDFTQPRPAAPGTRWYRTSVPVYSVRIIAG